MKRVGEAFVGIDTAKLRNAVAVAEAGRNGEIWYLGEFDNTTEATAKLIRKLSGRHEVLYFVARPARLSPACHDARSRQGTCAEAHAASGFIP